MKNKLLGGFQDSFKQLDFLVILVAYIALTNLFEWTTLQTVGVVGGCVGLSGLIDILLLISRKKPKIGSFFYTPCKQCGKFSSSHTLLGTICNNFTKPHFFLVFVMFFLISQLDNWTLTKRIVMLSTVIITVFLTSGLLDTLGTLFKKPETSETT
jgi:hypothetical protein